MATPLSQSPPRQQTTLLHDSPVHAKKVHSGSSYQSGTLDDARLVVLEDLGSCIPQITVQAFMDSLAPQLHPDCDIKGAMETLKSDPEGVLTASGRWRAFEKEPKHQTGKEDAIFKPMSEIFEQVAKAIITNPNSTLTSGNCSTDFLQNPTRAPMSVDRHHDTRPDGYIVVKDKKNGNVISWAAVALSCEYKLKDGDEQLDDDVRKCIWSMQHVMREDPCRRATFGMTIENTNTRFWFCCRSSVVVTEPFNFMTQPETLVKLFAAFAFADNKSLGYDPTIQRVAGVPSQFIMSVYPNNDIQHPRRFRTTKIISSYGAEPLRGRGTRVYEAIELDSNDNDIGSPVVLKDIWIDSDRMREGNILRTLHDDADEIDKKLVEKHFLTTVCHGDTDVGLMRGLKVTTHEPFELQRTHFVREKKESGHGSEGLRAISRLHAPHPILKYAHKTHYRIVFQEKGITIDLIQSLPDVMSTLSDAVTALQLLRKLGWVHRDVSVGNIMACEGGAKLADLEYAKKVGSVKSHEMRTGTMHFMAVEVAAQEFIFRTSSVPGDFATEMHQVKQRLPMNAEQDQPFSANHLHDLESLWWVAVWIVFYNQFSIPQKPNEESLPDIREVDRQLELSRSLFPSHIDSFHRRDGFQTSFLKHCNDLPSIKATVCGYLDILRVELRHHYSIVESTLPNHLDLGASKDTIYDHFKQAWAASCKDYPDCVLTFIPRIHARLKANLKRPRAESTNDTTVVSQKRRQ